MNQIVLRAKTILSNMFDFNSIHFEQHTTREVHIVEARRFLVNFLRDECNMTYFEILKHIPAFTNHATAIHHYKKMKEYFILEPKTRQKYQRFRSELVNHPNNIVEKEIIDLTERRKNINNKLNKFKKLL